jgi:hypothetical protein
MSTSRQITLSFIVACAVVWATVAARAQDNPTSSVVDEKNYVGNVYGTVTDAQTGQPLQGVEVVLTTKPLVTSRKAQVDALSSDKGYVVLPREFYSSELKALTDEKGEFIINSVPTPYPAKSYTIIVTSFGYATQILDQVPVRPGAVMSVHLTVALERGFYKAKVYGKGEAAAPFKYRDEEEQLDVPPSEPEQPGVSPGKPGRNAPYAAAVQSRTIFATREGLVGLTTANGHVIAKNDHFAALPSRTALAKNWNYDFQVRLTYKGRTVTAPVWEVGPHNQNDDYWNPSTIRAMWRNLPQGKPEAQAAKLEGYNGGRDEFGGKVQNPAGIDLADGTFADLKLSTNDWVQVEYLWTSGGADFSVSKTPDVATIIRGNTASFQLSVSGRDGFRSPVAVSVSGLPSGASASSSSPTLRPPLNGSDSTTFSVKTSSSTPTGTFTLTFSATCGGLTRQVTAKLIVNAPPPPPGTVKVVALLNGRTWSGSLNYYVSGPDRTLVGLSVPMTRPDLPPGKYSIGSISGSPGKLIAVGPQVTQTLNSNGTITFTLNFQR